MPNLAKLMIVVVLVLVLGSITCAQANTVYVSGGANIYQVANGVAKVLYTNNSANYASLAIGPDNVDTDGSGNASHAFLLYACDPAGNIIRFDPGNPATVQPVASSLGFSPVCGRSTSTEDFYVTDASGAGVYQLTSAGTPLGNASFSATAIGATANKVGSLSGNLPGMGRGITQKYVGDLLVVDNANSEVFRAHFGSFGMLAAYLTANLSSPVGISRISDGDVFVANSVLGQGKHSFPPVAHFDRNGNVASACPGLTFKSDETPQYLATAQQEANAAQSSLMDTIYLVTTGTSSGTLWTWNTAQGNCSLVSTAPLPSAVSGVAVAPMPVTLALQVNSSMSDPTFTTFNFNSSLFEFIATGCTATVEAYPLIPATVNSMITSARSAGFLTEGATPAPDLGAQGFETVYVAHWLNTIPPPFCTSVLGGAYETGLAGFVDPNLFTNPRELQCDNSAPGTEPTINAGTACMVPQELGVYPLGGPLAGDQIVHSNSVFALVNSGLTTASNTTNPAGLFCGYENPLLNPGQTGYPASFPSNKNTLAVKFKLADLSRGGTCSSGPYIDNATALISVAQIADANGVTTFNAINVNGTANSILTPPIYNTGNNQYSFTLTISGYAKGTYSLTTTFQSDNTTNQTIEFLIQ